MICRQRSALLCLIGASSFALNAQNLPDQQLAPPRLGVPASESELSTRNNLVFPDGRGLPLGTGTVAAGEALYVARCIACHGANGRGGSGGELAGGNPDLMAAQPDKTIGTYWPYATTLFDFIRRAMPLDAPWSLKDAEVYALVAYLLQLNSIVRADFVADAASIAALKMPNRGGFTPIDLKLPPSR
jgi:S-disulfanyl-L-cysteine oxidoreductase SoxD